MSSALSWVDDVVADLDTDRFGRAVRSFEQVGSTNTEATAWARDGAREGSIVVTDHQTDGRGRHGRQWTADPGTNLMLSVVLRPPLPPDRLGLVTLAAGVAVADAVDAFVSPHRATIKWPNDVLLEGRKTCGMLLEGAFAGQRRAADAPSFVILGIGLNVNQTHFPDALADTATSLRLILGRTVPRPPLFARLLEELERRYDSLIEDEGASVREAFHARMDRRGERVTLRFTGTDDTVAGTIRGVTATGALELDTDDGTRILHAGEVTTSD
jgi:BirA family biotin operon repressor/biotin-[acetyl-CoA-carboxylase] ligase